jgi:hypothetical protein
MIRISILWDKKLKGIFRRQQQKYLFRGLEA